MQNRANAALLSQIRSHQLCLSPAMVSTSNWHPCALTSRQAGHAASTNASLVLEAFGPVERRVTHRQLGSPHAQHLRHLIHAHAKACNVSQHNTAPHFMPAVQCAEGRCDQAVLCEGAPYGYMHASGFVQNVHNSGTPCGYSTSAWQQIDAEMAYAQAAVAVT